MTSSVAAAVLLTPRVYNDDTVSPGWLGLVVFLALALATFFLLRSMFHHLRKVPPSFDASPPGPEQPPPGQPPTSQPPQQRP